MCLLRHAAHSRRERRERPQSEWHLLESRQREAGGAAAVEGPARICCDRVHDQQALLAGQARVQVLLWFHVARHTSHVTRHSSHFTRHTSHVTRHTSHVTRHTSHVTRHTSHVTRHTSHVTHSLGKDGCWAAISCEGELQSECFPVQLQPAHVVFAPAASLFYPAPCKMRVLIAHRSHCWQACAAAAGGAYGTAHPKLFTNRSACCMPRAASQRAHSGHRVATLHPRPLFLSLTLLPASPFPPPFTAARRPPRSVRCCSGSGISISISISHEGWQPRAHR
jgi:hypothetical protein